MFEFLYRACYTDVRPDISMHQHCSFHWALRSLQCLSSDRQNNKVWWVLTWTVKAEQSSQADSGQCRKTKTHTSEEISQSARHLQNNQLHAVARNNGKWDSYFVCPISGGGGWRLTPVVQSPRQTLKLAFFCPYKSKCFTLVISNNNKNCAQNDNFIKNDICIKCICYISNTSVWNTIYKHINTCLLIILHTHTHTHTMCSKNTWGVFKESAAQCRFTRLQFASFLYTRHSFCIPLLILNHFWKLGQPLKLWDGSSPSSISHIRVIEQKLMKELVDDLTTSTSPISTP
jgi:hypothetical protein